jgi:hypothetical protein
LQNKDIKMEKSDEKKDVKQKMDEKMKRGWKVVGKDGKAREVTRVKEVVFSVLSRRHF